MHLAGQFIQAGRVAVLHLELQLAHRHLALAALQLARIECALDLRAIRQRQHPGGAFGPVDEYLLQRQRMLAKLLRQRRQGVAQLACEQREVRRIGCHLALQLDPPVQAGDDAAAALQRLHVTGALAAHAQGEAVLPQGQVGAVEVAVDMFALDGPGAAGRTQQRQLLDLAGAGGIEGKLDFAFHVFSLAHQSD
jgi:hypothetical protein